MNTHSGFTVRPILATRIAATACGAALALLVVSSALAGDAAKEVKTAAQHAELAAASDCLRRAKQPLEASAAGMFLAIGTMSLRREQPRLRRQPLRNAMRAVLRQWHAGAPLGRNHSSRSG